MEYAQGEIYQIENEKIMKIKNQKSYFSMVRFCKNYKIKIEYFNQIVQRY